MKIHVISPWYPDYASAYSGVFVEKQVHAVRSLGYDVTVEVPQIFPAPRGPIPAVVTNALRTLAKSSIEAVYPSPDGVTYVPTPVPSKSGHMGRATAVAAALQLRREFDSDDADITHAHLGMPTGWATSELHKDRPLVVTEHQSTLAMVLAEPAAANAYRQTIERASAFFCVSEHLRDQLARWLGEWVRDRVSILPNIVDLGDISFRPRRDYEFRSWVYVGGVAAHKGIEILLKTFATYRERNDTEATLTIVGNGPMRHWVERFAVSKGLSRSVAMVGAVKHQQVGAFLDQADVMVQLSPAETFGIAPLEGIGAGLPVISFRNGGAEGTWGDMSQECGLLLDPTDDPNHVATAIADLRDTPGRLDAEQGRQMVEARFSPDLIAQRLAETYMDCIQ